MSVVLSEEPIRTYEECLCRQDHNRICYSRNCNLRREVVAVEVLHDRLLPGDEHVCLQYPVQVRCWRGDEPSGGGEEAPGSPRCIDAMTNIKIMTALKICEESAQYENKGREGEVLTFAALPRVPRLR